MKIAMFSTKSYDRETFEEVNEKYGYEIEYLEPRLSPATARLAEGHDGVCIFVNDEADAEVLDTFADLGIRIVALRCAGFNNVDLKRAHEKGIVVVRVPAYSPHAVAEHALGLMLALNRKIHRAFSRVREQNFSLEGLMGFDMHGKTVGIIGTGRIGTTLAEIVKGLGCHILAHDPYPNDEMKELGAKYVDLDDLLGGADIVSLHCPLTPETHHLVDAERIGKMKRGVMLVNTSRGAIIDTPAVVDALKDEQIGSLGLDVYEEEGDLFFEDLSNQVIRDDVFARLLTFPNVVITGHQGYFTREALHAIASTTLENIRKLEEETVCQNAVMEDKVSS
jgi:D-lactate dehydrogenase